MYNRKISIKRKYDQIPRSKMERIGIPTGLLDKYGNQILSGDKIIINYTNPYIGRVLWNSSYGCYGLCFGLWYGDKNEFDYNCYGKFIKIPKDNGMRMEIEKL